MTWALSGVLAACYLGLALGQALRGVPAWALSHDTLAPWVLQLPLSGPGALGRVPTAVLCHIDAQHVLLNVAVLLALGWGLGLEQTLGGRRLLALFAVGCLCGAGAAVLYYTRPTWICGASAGLLGVIGGALAQVPGRRRWLLGVLGGGILLGGIWWHGDSAGHLGGLAGGLAMGLLHKKLVTSPRPAAATARCIAGLDD